MQYLKELLIKGRYSIFIASGILFEVERDRLLPMTKIYTEVTQAAKEELDFIDPQTDHKEVNIDELSGFDLDKLKSKTKKQVQ